MSKRPDLGPSPDGQCTSKSKATQQRCRRRATRGARVCVVHGAGSPAVKAKAKQRVALDEALKTVILFGAEPVPGVDPGEVLLSMIADMNARFTTLRSFLAGVPADQTFGEYRKVVDELGTLQQQLVKAASVGQQLGLEQQSALMMQQLAGLLTSLTTSVALDVDLALDATQQARVRRIMADTLRSAHSVLTPAKAMPVLTP